MLPRDIDDIQPGQAAPRKTSRGRNDRVEARRGNQTQRGNQREEDEGKLIDTLSPSTDPLMYVIDLLCDALALRVGNLPDRLSSGPMAKVPRRGEGAGARGEGRGGGGRSAKEWKEGP